MTQNSTYQLWEVHTQEEGERVIVRLCERKIARQRFSNDPGEDISRLPGERLQSPVYSSSTLTSQILSDKSSCSVHSPGHQVKSVEVKATQSYNSLIKDGENKPEIRKLFFFFVSGIMTNRASTDVFCH